jgi:glutamate:Na+ symporter, ESS family
MTHADIFWGSLLIGLLLMISKMIKARISLFEKLFLPSSIIAGFLALILGPQVLGRMVPEGAEAWRSGVFSPAILDVWRGLPGWLISIVFAALFLGKPIPGLKEIWIKAGPQVVFGQSLAWGQYVVGITLGVLVLTPIFGMSPLAGALIEISFEGGHGTAAGMAETFRTLGFPEGADLALGLATVGLVSGVLLGTILINWAARRNVIPLREGKPARLRDLTTLSPAGMDSDTLEELKELQWEKEQETRPTDPLSIHLGVVGLAVIIGWLIREALIGLETRTWGGEDGVTLIKYVPLFPLAMIGGVLVQWVVERAGQQHHISRRLMNRISGTALDFTIVAALGSLSLTAIGQYWQPFLLLAVAGITWNVWALLFLAPKLIPLNWFERGVGDFGQSLGVTVTGLLLMRMADPTNESGALESFGYKQLLFEPIVGGGLFTAASLPLIAQFGPVFVLILTSGILAFWLIFGYVMFGRQIRQHAKQP